MLGPITESSRRTWLALGQTRFTSLSLSWVYNFPRIAGRAERHPLRALSALLLRVRTEIDLAQNVATLR
jgi:hypothetical protein